MCGIAAAVGGPDPCSETIDALRRLEYRGYDSYGLGGVDDGLLVVAKGVGAIGEALRTGPVWSGGSLRAALGHTRWATHGAVSLSNSHPHLSFDGRVAVVHNGIVENHLEIRSSLTEHGFEFTSDTDTEVIAHLLGLWIREGNSMVESLARLENQIVGDYAVGAILLDEPDVIYGMRRSSALLVGRRGDLMMMVSDPVGLPDGLTDATFLEDGDIARLDADGVVVLSLSTGAEVARPVVHLAHTSEHDEEHRLETWMLQEIYQATAAIAAAGALHIEGAVDLIRAAERLYLVGAGSSYYVALLGQYFMAAQGRFDVAALQADEALDLMALTPASLVVVISQSGETYDTVAVARQSASKGVPVVGISNVPNSTVDRTATLSLLQDAGPEISVLSTKSVLSQTTILGRLAASTCDSELPDGPGPLHLPALTSAMDSILTDCRGPIEAAARRLSGVRNWFFIGQGTLYPVALESALKFREVTYQHAEGLSGGSLKHGSLSLIQHDFFTLAFLPALRANRAAFDLTLARASEISARGGPVVGFGPEQASPEERAIFATYIALPLSGSQVADAVLLLLAGQLFAHFAAVELGRDVDRPRSLAKSITVR
jgi:glucosamine--fructose-6-phosphate aminotransferase (isomerizing)